MRSLAAACLATLICANTVQAWQQPAPDVPAKSRESHQRDIDEAVDRLGGALRIRRDGAEDFPAAREQLRILDELLLRAPGFDLQGVTVPDRVQPRIDDARNRMETARQLTALCIRQSQENDPVERGRLTLQINNMLRDQLQTGPVTDTEDRAAILGVERVMRRRAEEERQRLNTLEELHAEFLRIMARASKLKVPVDGEYEGTLLIDVARSKVVLEIGDKKIETRPSGERNSGFLFFTIRGTEVTGEAVYGEEASRSVIRLKGRYDLATSSFEAADDGGRVPAGYPEGLLKAVDLKIKGKASVVRPQAGGNPLVAFDGTWLLRLEKAVDFTYQESKDAPAQVMKLSELVGTGSWQAN